MRPLFLTTIVSDAWRRKQPLPAHGWIYDLRDGLRRDLGCPATGGDTHEA